MELFVGKRKNENKFILVDQEFHHCIRVLRNKSGDDILITEFCGVIYQCRIQAVHQNELDAEIIKIFKVESPDVPKICIAISPTQPIARFEWFVEKAVENGIHEIIPLHCSRTETVNVRTERLEKIIESAAKQTQRPLKPKLYDITRLEEITIVNKSFPQKFIGHCNLSHEHFLGKLYKPESDVIVLIGPAGDFTKEELELARINNYVPVSLGPYRLRTETAGLTGLQILQTIRQL